MAKPKLTIALSHYDRHVPFFDGTVKADGIDLQVLIVGQSDRQRDGEDRHERMLQKAEFDVAELSLSSYLMAKSRGMPFTAIPVFPRRLFSHSQMWINVDAGISEPKDLVGKKVALHSFQNTLATLAKGDCRANRCALAQDSLAAQQKRQYRIRTGKGREDRTARRERQCRRYAGTKRNQRHDDAASAEAGVARFEKNQTAVRRS